MIGYRDLLKKKLENVLPDWKSYGAVSTPAEIVEQMIKLSGLKKWKGLDILEPACGFCNFLAYIYERYPKNNFFGVELNEEVYSKILYVYKNFKFNFENNDFLLWESKGTFDLVIGNPPYGIIGDASHYAIHTVKDKKQEYKKNFSTWSGKYNVYGAFIEKGVRLLKPAGTLVYIIPATWMILNDFKKLRKFLSLTGKTKVYYLGGKIFKGVTVSVCILVFKKNGQGLELYNKKGSGFVRSLANDLWRGKIIRFENLHTKKLEQNTQVLNSYFDIKISARSPEVRSFPGLLDSEAKDALPFINGRNVKRGFIDRMGFNNIWLKRSDVVRLKHFYGILPRIVVGHTKGGKIVAALEEELYPYIGDVYHLIPKVKIPKSELSQIIDWLNSQEMEKYTTTLYKDISPHITATQLDLIPLKIKTAANQLF